MCFKVASESLVFGVADEETAARIKDHVPAFSLYRNWRLRRSIKAVREQVGRLALNQ